MKEVEIPRSNIFFNIFLIIITLLVIVMLIIYYLEPFSQQTFLAKNNDGNTNFSLGLDIGTTPDEVMQFYPNMRYQDKRISYKINEQCSLAKKEDAIRALNILENKTILEFYPVLDNEEISIACEERSRPSEDKSFFVAGEGGPTNITSAGLFNIIHKGEILLIRKTNCAEPNIALHEFMHALGFEHSENPNNIMYEISNCDQKLGEDSIKFIDRIYSIPSQPDLIIKTLSAETHSRYLDFQIEIQNQGLAPSGEAEIVVYSNGDEIKSFPLEPIDVGYGRNITYENIFTIITPKELEFVIATNFEEINKKNNKKELTIA